MLIADADGANWVEDAGNFASRPSSRRVDLSLSLSFSSRVNGVPDQIAWRDEGDTDEGEGRQEVIRDKGTRRGTVLSKVRHRYDEGIIYIRLCHESAPFRD